MQTSFVNSGQRIYTILGQLTQTTPYLISLQSSRCPKMFGGSFQRWISWGVGRGYTVVVPAHLLQSTTFKQHCGATNISFSFQTSKSFLVILNNHFKIKGDLPVWWAHEKWCCRCSAPFSPALGGYASAKVKRKIWIDDENWIWFNLKNFFLH